MGELNEGLIVLKNGQTRYTAAYVKSTGLPYIARTKAHNGYAQRLGCFSWGGCKRFGLTTPTVEETPAQFVFQTATGANYYVGMYDRTQEILDRYADVLPPAGEDTGEVSYTQYASLYYRVFKRKEDERVLYGITSRLYQLLYSIHKIENAEEYYKYNAKIPQLIPVEDCEIKRRIFAAIIRYEKHNEKVRA